MMSLITQALTLITRPEGSAIYHIITLFALEAAFGIALSHRWRNGPASNATRLAIAAGLAGAIRLALLVLGPLGDNGLIPAPAIIAPLDRAITVATLLLIAWAAVIRPGNRWADLLLGLALVAVTILYIVLAILWYPLGAQGAYYNNTLFEAIWELAKLSIVLIALLALLFFRPADWGLAFGMFVILLAGIGFHLAFPTIPLDAENFPAAQRIAEMAAFPLFTVIVYRHALGAPVTPPASEKAIPTVTAVSTPKVKLTPQAASALAYIAVGSDENDFSKRVAEAVGRTLLADYTLIFAPPMSEDTTTCAAAFDLIREKHLPGFSVPARRISTISSAIARGRPARLKWDTHEQELAQLAQELGIQQYGSALMVPFAEDDAGNGQSLGGIVIMSAYTQKEWTTDDHNLLASIAKPLSTAFVNFNTKSRNTSDLLTDLDAALKRIEEAEASSAAAEERATRLAMELEQIREEHRHSQQQIESLTAIIQAESATTAVTAATTLAAESESPTASEPSFLSDEEFASLQSNYRRALEEMAALNEELSQTRSAFEQLKEDSAAVEASNTETIRGLNEQLLAKQSTLEQFKSESTDALVEFTDEINDLKARLEAAQSAPPVVPLASSMAALATDSTALAAARAERDRIIQELHDTRSELDYARQVLATAPNDEDLVQARTEVEQLRTEVQRLEGELAETRAKIDTKPLIQAAPQSADLADITRQLAEARSEIESLRSQLQSIPADAPSILRSHSEMLLSLIQDLRQPLSSVIGYSDLLMGESVGIISPLQRSFIERVKASAERMTNTIDDLIRVTAIDSGTLTLEEQNFDITDVIEDAFTSVGAQFREKSISLRMDIADEIPPIAADRDAILQIISRLLNNACTASEPNTEVILTARTETDSAMLVTVSDTGGGISERDLPRVFARFYRADRPLVQGLGDTGAGLSVAKALAEAQGGRIWVETEQGRGSTFSVVLPTNGHH